MKPRIDFNLLFVGDGAVGKSSLIDTFKKTRFERDFYIETLGLSLIHDQIEFSNYIIDITFWDVAGQKHYQKPNLKYLKIRKIDAVAIIYDLTRKKTLESALDWLLNIKMQDNNIFIAIVGNKSDLRHNHKTIINMIETYNQFGSIYHYVVSAKTFSGVEQTFYDIIYQALINKMKTIQPVIKENELVS